MPKYRICAFLTSIEWQIVEAKNEEEAKEKYFAEEGSFDDIDVTDRDIDSIREMDEKGDTIDKEHKCYCECEMSIPHYH